MSGRRWLTRGGVGDGGGMGSSTGVAQTSGDAVDADEQCVVKQWIVGALTHAMQELHLQKIDGIHVGVAHVNAAAQDLVVLDETLVPRDLQDRLDGLLQTAEQLDAKRLKLFLDETLVI